MIAQERLFAQARTQGVAMYVEHDTTVDRWIEARHYIHSVPAGAVIRMCFKDGQGRVIGCMMWGRPVSRKIDQDSILELQRMCFVDDTERFVESKSLALARRYIRKHFKRVKGIISYSSEGQGHDGTIYAGDNWYKLGGSSGGSWETRTNRKNRDLSQKTRWTRSP